MTSAANSNHTPSAPPHPDFFEHENFLSLEPSAPELSPEEAAVQKQAAKGLGLKTPEKVTPLVDRAISLTSPPNGVNPDFASDGTPDHAGAPIIKEGFFPPELEGLINEYKGAEEKAEAIRVQNNPVVDKSKPSEWKDLPFLHKVVRAPLYALAAGLMGLMVLCYLLCYFLILPLALLVHTIRNRSRE